MFLVVLLPLVLLTVASVEGQNQGTCKDPVVEKRLLSDDVRFASPFYVIALPRNSRTSQMDNVCYTYFEKEDGGFFHVMSVTYSNGSNTYYTYNKGDISDRMGVAQGTALSDSECVYHDYTLKPICNVSVFILYRCFTEGTCGKIDIGITPGVDVRVTLAANPKVSTECRKETEASLKDTSVLDGGDYVILPQKLKPQCVTRYNDKNSIGHQRAVGSKTVVEDDLQQRLGEMSPASTPAQRPAPPQPTRGSWPNQNTFVKNPPVMQTTPQMNSFNPYGTHIKPETGYGGGYQTQTKPPASGYGAQPNGYSVSYASSQSSAGQMHTSAWSNNNGQWSSGPNPWDGQTMQPGAETHYHMWQASSPASKPGPGKSNVYYHIHSWDTPPPGCCKCN